MKIRTIEPIEHDGKPVKVGKVIDLQEDAARALIAAKAAVDPEAEAAAAAAQAQAEQEAADRMAADARAVAGNSQA